MRAALRALPQEYAQRLVNVDFVVERHPSREERRRLGLRGGMLYGLYSGVPLTQRAYGYGNVVPDKITLYWGPLARDFPDDGTLAQEVLRTLYHEIGHFFGLDEDDLHETSVE